MSFFSPVTAATNFCFRDLFHGSWTALSGWTVWMSSQKELSSLSNNEIVILLLEKINCCAQMKQMESELSEWCAHVSFPRSGQQLHWRIDTTVCKLLQNKNSRCFRVCKPACYVHREKNLNKKELLILCHSSKPLQVLHGWWRITRHAYNRVLIDFGVCYPVAKSTCCLPF